MIRVVIPSHLQRLASAQREVKLQVKGTVTIAAILDALETRYPMLRGTIRDHSSKERRAFIRFFACGEDWSHETSETPLPEAIASGIEPLRIVGALAGG